MCLHGHAETIRARPPSKKQLIRFEVDVLNPAPRPFEDPAILTKPWTSAPRKWSLAAPDDEWTEVFSTHNEEPDEWKHIDKSMKDDYEDKYKK
jgi:hypothetical protein